MSRVEQPWSEWTPLPQNEAGCLVHGRPRSGRGILPRGSRPPARRRAFTLVEVLAALLMMAIVIPVAMEGMSIASRAGVMGTRKAAAMRVAERLLNELVIGNQLQQSSSSGTIEDGDTTYPWTMRTEAWSEDAMLQMTVTVNFVVRGNTYDVSVSTLVPTTPADTEAAATQQ